MLPPTVAPTMIRTAANSVQKFLLRSPNIVRGWCPANSGLAGADSGGCDTLRYPYASWPVTFCFRFSYAMAGLESYATCGASAIL
jgi:hypothetical protein